jgi:hypothetical protein
MSETTLKTIREQDFHCFYFFEDEDTDNGVKVEGHHYDKEVAGEFVEGTSVGHPYHIVLMKDHSEDENKFAHFDCFEAILADPLTYIMQLVPQGWYGIIARKSANSQQTIDLAVDNIKPLL